MNWRWRKLILFGLSFFGVAVALWYWGTREPVFEGRSVSEWLVNLDERQSDKLNNRAENAIRQLGATAVPTVVRSLKRHDSFMSGAIAEAVGDPLRYATAEQHKKRALTALRILGPAAKSAMPTLQSLFQNGEMPLSVGLTISAIDPASAVEPFTQALSQSNLVVRKAAVWLLSDIASNAEPAIPQLVAALNDADLEIRRGAARALGRIHKRPEVVVPALAAGLADTNWDFKYNALIGLQQFGADAKSAVPTIERCLVDTNAGHRAAAAVTLWYVDRPSADRAGYSTAGILKMLETPDRNSRQTGLVALWMLQDMLRDQTAAIIAAAIPCLSDTNSYVRYPAVTVLRAYGQRREDALTALAPCLEDPDPGFRRHVTNAIVVLAPNYFVKTNH